MTTPPDTDPADDGTPAAVGERGQGDTPATAARRSRLLRAAVVAGGAVLTVAGTVVVTLAATHNSAVKHNLRAYANGVSDTLAAIRDGVDFDEL